MRETVYSLPHKNKKVGIEQKKEIRGIPYYDKEHKKQIQNYEYNLVFKGGKLLNVINKSGYSVEKNSECFQYFLNKHK